jgi:hypothetical protein
MSEKEMAAISATICQIRSTDNKTLDRKTKSNIIDWQTSLLTESCALIIAW